MPSTRLPPFRRRVRAAVRAAAGPLHPLPDFLIIGTKKGGSSSLNRYLRQHPNVRGAKRKEVWFFNNHWHYGTWWYRTWFPPKRRIREQEQRTGQRCQVFEATPTYLHVPEVPERVASVLPAVRLVAVLRDPVERAWSDYRSLVAEGREHRSFAEAAAAELDAGGGRLLGPGRYAEHLERWWQVVPRERLLVVLSDDLFADEAAAVRRVTDFLGLAPHDGYDLRPANVGDDRGRYDDATGERLRSYFAPHNRRLAELLGRDLAWVTS